MTNTGHSQYLISIAQPHEHGDVVYMWDIYGAILHSVLHQRTGVQLHSLWGGQEECSGGIQMVNILTCLLLAVYKFTRIFSKKRLLFLFIFTLAACMPLLL